MPDFVGLWGDSRNLERKTVFRDDERALCHRCQLTPICVVKSKNITTQVMYHMSFTSWNELKMFIVIHAFTLKE